MEYLPWAASGSIVVAFILMLVGIFRDHRKPQLAGPLVMALGFAACFVYDIRHGARTLAALDAALVVVDTAGFFGLRRGLAKVAAGE